MRHVPHLVVGAPWEGDELTLSLVQWRHLTKVLRMRRGDTVTYTDGLGRLGEGTLGSQLIERGEERETSRPSGLTLAVAPPANKDRQRFLVEKLAELGVSRLRWLETRHGKNRVTPAPKVFSWVLSAVEQSRGAWLMETDPGLSTWEDLEGPVVVCQPGGDGTPPSEVGTVVIGPEGGFAEEEVPIGYARWDLGPTILRTETAAVVAAVRLMNVGRR